MRIRNFTGGLLLSIILHLMLMSCQIQAQTGWQNIGPGGGSDLLSSAVCPNNPDIVYIGGDIEGVFKTTDGGQHWRSVNNNLARGPWTPDVYWINQIVFDPGDASNNTLYLCTSIGLFKTTNGGESWQLYFPQAIVSEDDFIEVQSVAVDPGENRIVYIGTSGSGLVETKNGGASFEAVETGMNETAAIFGIVVDPAGDSFSRKVYLGTMDGIYKSADSGDSWSSANAGLPHREVWNLKGVVFNGKTRLYASLVTHGSSGNAGSFQGGLYMSDDDAGHWTNISGNLPNYQSDERFFYYYWKFSVNPLNPNSIYIGTSIGYPDESSAAYEAWGIYKTVDSGAHWNRVDNQILLGWMDDTFFDERHALVLEMAPSDTSIVYWGRDWMKKTTDVGKSWSQIYTEKSGDAWIGHGLEMMMVESIVFDPTHPQRLFVGYDDMGPFRSDDRGVSFRPLDQVMDPYDGYDAAKDIDIDPDNGDIYMSRYDGMGSAAESGFGLGQVWKSTDHGDSWQKISNGLADGRPDLVLDPRSGSPGARILYCVSFGHGVFKSINSGQSWHAINNGLGGDAAFAWEIMLNPNNVQELYLGINRFGDGGGLYKSTDAGSHWSRSSSFPAEDVLCLAIDPANNLLYAGATENYDWSGSGGLYRSGEDGASWQKILAHPRIVDLEINPNNPNVLFAASQSWYEVWLEDVLPGVYLSRDGGSSWENITKNMGHTFVTSLALDPENPDKLYAGTGGGGLWVNGHATTDIAGNEHLKIVENYLLYQNYPNPFNPTTTIKFAVKERSHVLLKIYDMRGREIMTLIDGDYQRGQYETTLDAQGQPSGVYFYCINAGEQYNDVKKMLLLK